MFYKTIKYIVGLYYKLRFKINVVGEENIPKEGPVLLASNHISLNDPPAISVSIERELSFFAKSDLFKYPIFGKAISKLNAIPVNRGKGDRSALKSSVKALEEGRMLLMFPEGHRNSGNTDELQPLQEGTSFIALKSKTPIIPVAIRGDYKSKNGITIVFGQEINIKQLSESGVKRKEITSILEKNLNNLLKKPIILDKSSKI